jgi:hypothetical protein
MSYRESRLLDEPSNSAFQISLSIDHPHRNGRDEEGGGVHAGYFEMKKKPTTTAKKNVQGNDTPQAKDAGTAIHQHPTGHCDTSSSCAICRIKTLELAVSNGDEAQAVVLHKVAVEAAVALERLREAGNSGVADILANFSHWPIVVTYPDEKRPWLKQLGSRSVDMPLSWRKLFYTRTLSRELLLCCFKFISALGNLSKQQMAEEDAKLAKPLPKNLQWTSHLIPQYLKDPVFVASFRHELDKATQDKSATPEMDDSPTSPKQEVYKYLAGLIELLGLQLSRKQIDLCVQTFMPKAAVLSSDHSPMEEWYAVAKELIYALTGNEPAKNAVLRTLAPNNRGKRKFDNQGTAKESLGEIRTRIFEMLELPLKRIKRT